jgi:AcrR family transcriptional regulator
VSKTESRPYKQVARAQSQQRTRDALLDVADEEFSAGRWTKASLDAMAARAGVTKQTVLRHFGSKDGLLEAAIRRTSEIVRRERAHAPTGEIPGAVHNLVVHYERWGNAVLRLLAEEHRGSLVRKLADRGRDVHYEWVEQTFGPQLAGLDEQTRRRRKAQLVTVCDVHMWKLFRHDLHFSVSDTEAALREIIEGVVAR